MTARRAVRQLPARPAETGGGLVAVATLVAALLGADKTTVAELGVAAGTLPALLTFLASHGGIVGLASAVWRGQQ